MQLTPADLLIFAPHPDDESVGAAGVIQQAIGAGRSVRVIFVTSGDGYPQAASALFKKPVHELQRDDFVSLAGTRQLEAVAAATVLGLSPSDVLFLGYPDAALSAVCANESGASIVSPFTERQATYGPALPDYHTLVHGQPGAYRRSSILGDITRILGESGPAQVYVTDKADTHPDHEAACHLVAEVASSTGYAGDLLTMVVHSGSADCWPWPNGATPRSPFQQHEIDGITYPKGARWPPPVRVPLTASQCAVKLQAIAAHVSQVAVDGDYLESFVKAEELFWRPRQAL